MRLESIPHFTSGDGPPILFVNGQFQTYTSWFGIMRALKKTHKTIAFDFPNQGEAPVDPTYTTMEQYTAYAADFIRALDVDVTRLTAFGFSSGADVVRSLETQHGFRFRRVVLAGVNPGGLEHYFRQMVEARANALSAGGLPSFASLLTFKIFSPAFFQQYPEASKMFAWRFSTMFGERLDALRTLIELTVHNAGLAEPPSGFRCPVHVVSGDDDQVIPPRIAAAYAARIGATFHTVPGGHAFSIESEAETVRLLRSLVPADDAALRPDTPAAVAP